MLWPPHRAHLGAHNPSAGPIDRDLGGSQASTGPMDRDFCVLGSFLVLSGASWELFWLLSAPLSTHLGSQGALNSPKQLPRRPQCEPNGPMKPPSPIRKRIWTYLPEILGTKSMKTRAQESKDRLNQRHRDTIARGPKRPAGMREAITIIMIRTIIRRPP